MRSVAYALKIRVLLAALAVMPTVCAALTPPPPHALPPPLAATALYPSSDAVANKATPTLSARYDNPAGSAGTVRFEVYDVGGITLVATGIGPAVLPGARSSWTVPTGLLVSGRAYQWRAQAQGATTWSALTDLGIDVVNGVSIPDAEMPFSWDALAYYRADFAWWYDKWNWPIVASYTWAGAGNFARFLLNHHHAYAKAYQNQAAVGDIILWDYGQNGDINHVSVVVRRIGNNVYYGQHSTDRDNELLANGIARAKRECRCIST